MVKSKKILGWLIEYNIPDLATGYKTVFRVIKNKSYPDAVKFSVGYLKSFVLFRVVKSYQEWILFLLCIRFHFKRS